VRAVAVSEDGSTVVVGSYDQMIYVFGRQSNATLWKYETTSNVLTVAVSADGSTIVTGVAAPDNTIRVFGRESNTTVWTYKTGSTVDSVAVSADGNTIVAGGSDNKVRVFGRTNNATIWTYTGVDDVRKVAVSADGNTIVTQQYSGTICVFGKASNATIWKYNFPIWTYDAAVSDDGNTIAAVCGYFVAVFGRQSNTTVWTYSPSGVSPQYGVSVSRDGTTIATGGSDHIFKVFGRSSNTTLVARDIGGSTYRGIAMSSDGSVIACGSIGSNPRAFLFSRSLGLLAAYDTGGAVGYSSYGPGVAVSGDGSLIAYGCDDDKLYVFQYDTVAPILGIPSVAPSSPVGGQNLNISISVADNIGVSAVTLYYRNTSAGSWSSVVMSLTGAAYKATIGPFSSGDVVSYYTTAGDTSGNTAGSPADAPLSYYTITVGTPAPKGATTPEGIQWTSVLIGAGLGAIIAIVVSFVLLRGKKSGK
jgi:WD40 repeat protein